MAKEDLKKRVLEETDFIKSKKYGNSLNKYLANNDGVLTDSVVARLLMLSEEEVEEIYKECVCLLQKDMVDSNDKE